MSCVVNSPQRLCFIYRRETQISPCPFQPKINYMSLLSMCAAFCSPNHKTVSQILMTCDELHVLWEIPLDTGSLVHVFRFVSMFIFT